MEISILTSKCQKVVVNKKHYKEIFKKNYKNMKIPQITLK